MACGLKNGDSQYSEGNDYWAQFTTSTFPYSSSYRYRNIGIVCAFIGFNFFLMYGELAVCGVPGSLEYSL